MPNPAGPKRVGRPRSSAAQSHVAIMEAVHTLLQEKSVRDLTIEEVAKRARVSKPTIYKWWPTKTALVMTLLHERTAFYPPQPSEARNAERALRWRVQRLIVAFNGLFGKVMADMIAEGQSEPSLLRELFAQHIGQRRAGALAEIERGKAAGELAADLDSELLLDSIFAPIYFRLLVRNAPLTQEYGEALVSQALRGLRQGKT